MTSISSPIGATCFAVLAVLGLVNERRSVLQNTIAGTGGEGATAGINKSGSLHWFLNSPGINSSLCALSFLWSAGEACFRSGVSALPLALIYGAFAIGLTAVARATNQQNHYTSLPKETFFEKLGAKFYELCPTRLSTILKDSGPWFAIGNLTVNALFLGKLVTSITLSTAIPAAMALAGGSILLHAAWVGLQPLFNRPQRVGHSSLLTGVGDIGIGVGSLFLGNPIIGIGTVLYGISNLLFGYQAKMRAQRYIQS